VNIIPFKLLIVKNLEEVCSVIIREYYSHLCSKYGLVFGKLLHYKRNSFVLTFIFFFIFFMFFFIKSTTFINEIVLFNFLFVMIFAVWKIYVIASKILLNVFNLVFTLLFVSDFTQSDLAAVVTVLRSTNHCRVYLWWTNDHTPTFILRIVICNLI